MKGIIFTSLLAASVSVTAQAETYTFGIVPQQSASRLASQWGPILTRLSLETGHNIEFATAADIPTFEENLRQGKYDFSYMNPYHYAVFSEASGYRALAKAKDKQIKGIIVVKKDSGITSIEQLNGQALAFPSPAAFAASILTRADIQSAKVDFTPYYVSSHDSVYLSVAKGFYSAGGGIVRTFNSLPEETRQQLTPIWSTKGYTPHAVAAHASVPENISQQIQQALVTLTDDPKSNAALLNLKIKAFTPAQDSDWDDVRNLNISLLEQ